MQLQGRSWFVKLQGKIRGPFTADVILSMNERGRLERETELSPNRQEWFAAALFVELFPPELPPAEGPLPSDEDQASEIQYYFNNQGVQAGPITFAKLQELASSGGLSHTDIVWHEGASNWFPVGNLPGLIFKTETTTLRDWLKDNRALACLLGASILAVVALPIWYIFELSQSRANQLQDKKIQRAAAVLAAETLALNQEEELLREKLQLLKDDKEETLTKLGTTTGDKFREHQTRYTNLLRTVDETEAELDGVVKKKQAREEEEELAKEQRNKRKNLLDFILTLSAGLGTTILTVTYFLYRSGFLGGRTDPTAILAGLMSGTIASEAVPGRIANAKSELEKTRQQVSDEIDDSRR